ncbi:MAG TPA: BREX system P-loop protein BrxC [Clostridia bacterium]|nr:BREX system P-loop protein BrxC [Clostridia bacterium]
MLIKDMFVKPIDRDIRGVVKVGQDDEKIVKNELEEYVVTQEMQKHFRDFFDSYERGINDYTDNMGVWISGFFGSGKSHFLKILSYLLDNREVGGKRAIDYFIEDEKIKDPAVMAKIRLAGSISTDAILFNIDSESETSGKKDKDSILNVFLKVFNQKLGYSMDPHLADLERQLNDEGRYQEYKDKYLELWGEEWETSRHKFNFLKDRAIDALVAIDFMSIESARNWAEGTISPYKISIRRFAERIRDYIGSKGSNHHVVFLVDEVGQYIGSDSSLMLNLQTITEELGIHCRGKAWVVVTSQQDIDSITEVIGEDFSKIQGRFDTRLSLTSANVDEVIKHRILEKTETANKTLGVLFENKETILKNLIIFNDQVEKKTYRDKREFCQIYPFIPYQFDILGKVLTSIRKFGASGKHLSEGERSMLALFKESAEKFMEKEDGTIIPFNIFYDPLQRFLDHSHSVVISRALRNQRINFDLEEDNFNVNVLKALFLIKYVDEIEANLENITTLMVSNIDDDRIELKNRVADALEVLVGQMLVQRTGDIYIFLTDEEQEINRMIEAEDIQQPELVKKISELIFADIFTDERIRIEGYSNRYFFEFNRFLDDAPYRANQAFDFGVKIITPISEYSGQGERLRMLSSASKDVYVDLPEDDSFLNELRLSMKIEKFLLRPKTMQIAEFEKIKEGKRVDRSEHENNAKLFLRESLKDAKFYINGDLMNLRTRDFKSNLTEALERLAETVYHKLNYITSPMDEVDINNLLRGQQATQLRIDNSVPNENALREVMDYIRLRTRNHTKIALREIKSRFRKAPYGFLDVDTEWLIAKAFIDGSVEFTLSGKSVSLLNERPERIAEYIIKRTYGDKLLIEEKEVIPERLIKSLRDIGKEVLKIVVMPDDTDAMVLRFNDYAKAMVQGLNDLLQEYRLGDYPGEGILKDGVKLIYRTTGMDKSIDVFKYVHENQDDYLDFIDDFPYIKAFFEGTQRPIWERAQGYIEIFDESSAYILSSELETITGRMKEILMMSRPYNFIKELPELNERFLKVYSEILDKELAPILVEIEDAKIRVLEEVEKSGLEEIFEGEFRRAFIDLKTKAKDCNNVAKVNGFRLEADKLKIRFLNEITGELQKRAREQAKTFEVEKGRKPEIRVVKPVKRKRNISIKDINVAHSWQVETREDIDRYLTALRKRLEQEIEENTIINIEF